MAEDAQGTAASEGASGDATATQGATDDGVTATQPVGDFVPRADFDRLNTQLRGLQGVVDRLQATPPAPASGEGNGEGEFDPAAFRRQMIGDVMQVSALQRASDSLRTEFKHADPVLFGERLADFSSPEALRIAAEDSHRRVQSALDAQKAELEQSLLQSFAEKYGVKIEGSGGPQGGSEGDQGRTGDPTPEQFARMSLSEQMALEADNPGVSDRILKAAGA